MRKKTLSKELSKETLLDKVMRAIHSRKPLSKLQKRQRSERAKRWLYPEPSAGQILFEIRRADGYPKTMYRHIYALSFFDDLTEKLSIWPTHNEQYLQAALDALGHALYKALPNSAMDRDIGRLAYVYSILSRTDIFRPYELHEWFVDHLNLRKRTIGRDRVKEIKPKLSEEQKRHLFRQYSLPTKDVAALFGTKVRQVQRWRKKGMIHPRHGLPRGHILRQDYLTFSRESVKYGHLVRDFNRLMSEQRDHPVIRGQVKSTSPVRRGKITKRRQP